MSVLTEKENLNELLYYVKRLSYVDEKNIVLEMCIRDRRTPLTEESIKARLSKLGGTQFYAGNISADIDDGLILSASAINDMQMCIRDS